MKLIVCTLLTLIFVSTPIIAADKKGIISRDTSLYAKPFKDADILVDLSANTPIIIIKRKGGWYEINASDKQGWVRLTRVRLNRKAGASNESSSGVGELLSGLATGRGKSSQDTTATAVKGLSEEELLNAEPDIDALNALDNFAVSDDANDESGLQTRQIDFQPTTRSESKTEPSPTENANEDEDEE